MKKKRIHAFIALFWGFNFIFLFLYAIISGIINLIKRKKDEVFEDEDYKRQFNIIISIPIITIIFLIFNSLLFKIPQILVNYIILTIYQLGIIISIGIILFYPEEILKLFDKKVSNILLTYQQFGIFIIADLAFQIILVSSWRFYYNSNTFFLLNIISLITLSLLTYRYYKVLKKERKEINQLAEFEQLINLQTDSFSKLRKNIIQIQEQMEKMLKEEENEQVLKYIERIEKKCQKLLKIAKKIKNREYISAAMILQKKTRKQKYNAKRGKDVQEIKELQDKLQEFKKEFSQSGNQYQTEKLKIIIKLQKIIKKRINAAKQFRNQNDIMKFSEMLKKVKK